MRSIEYLAQLFPEKTGKELFKIQKEDKQQDEFELQEANKEKISIVEDINKNGGYYRGAFGTDQYYMYNITKIDIERNNRQIYCEVERITLFDSQNINKGSVLSGESINFEIRQKESVKFEDITLMTTRITEEEYNELKNYLFGVVPKFFKEEWNLRQKEFGKSKKQ
jgi:hypothetical protein